MRSRYLAPFLVLALALAGCAGDDADPVAEEEPPDADAEEPPEGEPAEGTAGEGEPTEAPDVAAALDCNAIELVVPNQAGGGSDQQIRRLEPLVSEHFDTNVNVVYREGAGGSIAWGAMLDAAPDGCTVANVVSPNVVTASMGGGAEFAADDFTYLAWTEVAPTALIVANEAEWETLEDFLDAARENPGGLTVAVSGAPGEVIAEQISAATDVELTFVPMEGGIGSSVSLLLGDHVDAAVTHSSHATGNADTIRALGLGGEERVDSIGDVPTFHELGYEGFTVLTAQGLLAPPDTPDDIVQAWQDAIESAMEQNEPELTRLGLNRMNLYGDDALGYIHEQMEVFGLR